MNAEDTGSARPGTLTPYLTVKDAARAIEFYVSAFGARKLFHLTGPDGRIGHAELEIGHSRFMLSDEYPDHDALSPHTIGGSPVKFHLYVENADAAVDRAVRAGAMLVRPVADQSYGDRSGMVTDPFGHSWFLATQKEQVSPEEMQRRWSGSFETVEMDAVRD